MYRTVACLVVVVALLGSAPLQAADEFDHELEIVAGHQEIFASEVKIGGISNSNPRIVRDVVDRDRNEIIFFATKPGSATYIIFDRKDADHRVTILVTVVDKDLGETAQQLRSLFHQRGLDGIAVSVAGRNVLVEGAVTLPKDLVFVNKILTRYPEALNLVTIDQSTLLTLVEAIEREIDRPSVEVTLRGGTVFLEGWVTSEDEKRRAEEIAEAILGGMDSKIQVR